MLKFVALGFNGCPGNDLMSGFTPLVSTSLLMTTPAEHASGFTALILEGAAVL